MTNTLSDWYKTIYGNLFSILEEPALTDRMIQYHCFSVVWNCFGEEEARSEKSYLEALLSSLFDSLGVVSFEREAWESFFYKKENYRDFARVYNLPENFSLKELGSFWADYIMAVDRIPKEQRMQNLRYLIEYKNWYTAFCKVFAYQYWVDKPCPLIYRVQALPLLLHWKYSQAEAFLDTVRDLPIGDRVARLSQQDCKDSLSRELPDRESLFLDLVNRRVPVSEAISITKALRMGGRSFTLPMQSRLLTIGYTKENIEALKQRKYIKSWTREAVKILFVSNLLEA